MLTRINGTEILHLLYQACYVGKLCIFRQLVQQDNMGSIAHSYMNTGISVTTTQIQWMPQKSKLLAAPGGPHVGPLNLANKGSTELCIWLVIIPYYV